MISFVKMPINTPSICKPPSFLLPSYTLRPFVTHPQSIWFLHRFSLFRLWSSDLYLSSLCKNRMFSLFIRLAYLTFLRYLFLSISVPCFLFFSAAFVVVRAPWLGKPNQCPIVSVSQFFFLYLLLPQSSWRNIVTKCFYGTTIRIVIPSRAFLIQFIVFSLCASWVRIHYSITIRTVRARLLKKKT